MPRASATHGDDATSLAVRSVEARPRLPQAPALATAHGRALLIDLAGEVRVLAAGEVGALLRELPPPLLIHAPATFRRLGIPALPAYDLLELFLFACPGRRAAPSARGLARALALDPPGAGLEAAAAALYDLAAALLAHLRAARSLPHNREAGALAALLGAAGWGWAPFVAAALGTESRASGDALRVWRHLPEWEETAPEPPAGSRPIGEAEARARLAALLGNDAEARPGQADYAAAVSHAFAPRAAPETPRFVLAEAGTGIGKTLGYIAPASLWAERNRAPVWISTYTRHLQRQVEAELARLYADPVRRRAHVVVRKGRENYLCLLNLADAGEAALGKGGPSLIPLGLLARWAAVSADGDLFGGDLPGWFAELFGRGFLLGLADRRGECIHAACPLWHRCFIEHGIRRAASADLVVSNHALTMTQAAWGGPEGAGVPLRYVFDEGHHLFEAADAAFATILSGTTMAELRRWLLGAEGGRSRARGIARRYGDLIGEDAELARALEDAIAAAHALPAPGWPERIAHGSDAELFGYASPAEAFLRAAASQTLARAAELSGRRAETAAGLHAETIEADLRPLEPALAAAGKALAHALEALAAPLSALGEGLKGRLDREAVKLAETERLRIEAAVGTLARRALGPLAAWREMLAALAGARPDPEQRPKHVALLRMERRGPRAIDVGLFRHWLDPTEPLALLVLRPAHGVLVTSATLRDGASGSADETWRAAEARLGAPYLPAPPIRVSVQSPFDFAAQTRVFVVTDVAITDIDALAGAFRELFLAARGGALGLFTAIRRLILVQQRIAPALAQAAIPLYAQHVDAMDNATLAELFRAEEESCLLGTDAMRDGLDVPGRALRLVVFEKVPWARPDILHRERRRFLATGDPKSYDDRMARLRLRQAFGRLIRTKSDRGVFVLLDRRTPSRLLSAFPPGVTPRRAGLAEVIAATRAFLAGEPEQASGTAELLQ